MGAASWRSSPALTAALLGVPPAASQSAVHACTREAAECDLGPPLPSSAALPLPPPPTLPPWPPQVAKVAGAARCLVVAPDIKPCPFASTNPLTALEVGGVGVGPGLAWRPRLELCQPAGARLCRAPAAPPTTSQPAAAAPAPAPPERPPCCPPR